MTLASYVDVFFLYCCTLCMLCILHLIQKHLDDSRSSVISYLKSRACCEDRLLDRLTYFLAQKTKILSVEIVGS